jgi:hypothetical protein
MLAGSVDAFKRLFMKQAGKTVLFRSLAENIHCQLVLVNGDVSLGEDRRQFKLTGSDFVVFGFCIDAKLPEFFIDFFHEG